ncbi:hypothetical protein ACIPZ8_02455 [Pseudomonas sp. NPDC089422]|uniref:hypothetical protein n=1 Tax=Pseudomonas sp. NPDC089422 TaxID=3364466 RepID=UPI003815E604
MEYVLLNVSNYLTFAYSDSRRALERVEDEETRQLLLHGLRAIQIAWGRRMRLLRRWSAREDGGLHKG